MAVACRITVPLSRIAKARSVLLAMSSLAIVLLGLLPGQSWARGAPEQDEDDKVMLICALEGGGSDLYLLINKDEGIAQIVSITHAPDGELITNDTDYVLHFPKTDSRWEAVMTVNRYSGELVWEFGTPPFGIASLRNVVRTGTCEQKKPLKKF